MNVNGNILRMLKHTWKKYGTNSIPKQERFIMRAELNRLLDTPIVQAKAAIQRLIAQQLALWEIMESKLLCNLDFEEDWRYFEAVHNSVKVSITT